VKLIVCPACWDVRALAVGKVRTCECGASGGRYVDDLNAEIWGRAIPLGFANGSFRVALLNQPQAGDGARFVAFVIPRECDTVAQTKSPADEGGA
jgi:hypothetical protein